MAVGASAAAAILNWPARQASEDIGAPGTARTCNPQIRSLSCNPRHPLRVFLPIASCRSLTMGRVSFRNGASSQSAI